MLAEPQKISVGRIFLDLGNPRHEPGTNEADVIDYLCRHEYLYPLAKDIAKIGLNPLELFGLVPVGGNKRGKAATAYVAVEGNRRICAIKLLNDPDLAPADLRKDFRKLAESAVPITEVLGVVLDDSQKEDWLERIHGGPQGGIGRKAWNAEQKTRHLGSRKNALAQAILDYAEERNFISPEQRKGKLTTAQRYLGNRYVREAMGIDNAQAEDISITRPREDFDVLVQSFMRDLVANTVHSRSDAEAIKQYSRDLSSMEGVSTARIPSASLSSSMVSRKVKRKLKEPQKPKSITHEQAVAAALKKLASYKLQKLYFSICDVPLENHTPLISVGVWSFFETLTARCGRTSTTPFTNFLNHNKLTSLGFSDKESRKTIIQAVEHISACGNTTKHHDTAANFNGEQLVNDMDTIKELILALIGTAKA